VRWQWNFAVSWWLFLWFTPTPQRRHPLPSNVVKTGTEIICFSLLRGSVIYLQWWLSRFRNWRQWSYENSILWLEKLQIPYLLPQYENYF
jgi:hypothetical protein